MEIAFGIGIGVLSVMALLLLLSVIASALTLYQWRRGNWRDLSRRR